MQKMMQFVENAKDSIIEDVEETIINYHIDHFQIRKHLETYYLYFL